MSNNNEIASLPSVARNDRVSITSDRILQNGHTLSQSCGVAAIPS
jgi:hypothetical protein